MYHKNFKEFFDNQIQNAKTIVLSRTQKASDEKIEEVVHLLHHLNEEANYIISDWDELTSAQILEAMDQSEEVEEECCCCGHHHHEHHHGEHHHG